MLRLSLPLLLLAVYATSAAARGPSEEDIAQQRLLAEQCQQQDAAACEALGMDVPDGPMDAFPLARYAPEYPSMTARRGVIAACAIRFDIAADGRTTNICTKCNTNASSHPLADTFEKKFKQAATKAVSKWRYATPNGYRADAKTVLNFSLKNTSSATIAALEKPAHPYCKEEQGGAEQKLDEPRIGDPK